jgi:N-acetyltransferase
VSLVLDIPFLEGALVRLEPLLLTHSTDLAEAAEEDRSTFGHTRVPDGSDIDRYIGHQLQQAHSGKLAPLAQIRLADNRAVGCTAFWDPRAWPGRPSELCAVEIGWTWLAASAQGTGINVEAKLLLLRHAFEGLGVVRVDLKTDARNSRSRKAIVGLGAKFEGTLRNFGRLRGCRARRAGSGTRPCIRSLMLSGLTVRLIFTVAWKASQTCRAAPGWLTEPAFLGTQQKRPISTWSGQPACAG